VGRQGLLDSNRIYLANLFRRNSRILFTLALVFFTPSFLDSCLLLVPRSGIVCVEFELLASRSVFLNCVFP
jgi:hypothetical protein